MAGYKAPSLRVLILCGIRLWRFPLLRVRLFSDAQNVLSG